MRTISYQGIRLIVPANWPVYHLGAGTSTCVRFNRHAVYLGRPGTNQDCPLQAIGRTEAILVSPSSYGGLLTPVSRLAAGPAGGSMLRIDEPRRHAVITATWAAQPAVIRRALGLRSLRAAMLATDGHRPPPAADVATRFPAAGADSRGPRAVGHEVSPASPATPGEVYAGLGFDTCTTQSQSVMSAWAGSSPYGAVGIYIGGANAACLGGNLNAAWVSAQSAIGWHLLPLYVGLQAPGGCCQAMSTALTNGQFVTAAAQGTAAAQDAVAQAQALGIGTGNPIYYDMENYRRSATSSGAVLAFLQAWTAQLHTSGYLSGVYSSGSSGVTDLVDSWGTTYIEPDELWTASWDSSAPASPPTSPANNWVPSADWPGTHQLLQYWSDPSGTTENYGGAKINVDDDYVQAPTAAAGSGSFVSQPTTPPAVAVKPQSDGTVQLTPSWAGEPGITAYTILGGSSPTTLVPIETVSATSAFPVTLNGIYAYYGVQGLNSLGQVVGASAPVQAPPSFAIFGHSAYVAATGPVGVPVACLNVSPCHVQAAIYYGRRRLTHTGIRSLSGQGTQMMFSLSARMHRLIATAQNRRLPVTVTLLGSGGVRATRALNLIPYTISGRAPAHRAWPSAYLKILGETSFVSNGWTGGVLAVCTASTPCVSTINVTLGGAALAAPQTQTLGPGEVGYLTYTLNPRGHALLRARIGNQMAARVTVSTQPAPPPAAGQPTGGAPTSPPAVGTATSTPGVYRTAMALVSLVGFR